MEFRPFTNIHEYRMAKSIFANAFTHTSFTRADMIRAWVNCDRTQSLAFYSSRSKEMIGFILIQTCDPGKSYIKYLAIGEKWRGYGLGTIVMKRIMRFYQSKGISLEVIPLLPVLSWYQSLGFKMSHKYTYYFHRYGTRSQTKALQ
jgi:ribosomal protein S18 acetylase RimI-like enzyme